jgi:dihydrodipicolinate synthase/N-acetylneuraminate lyase
VTSPRPPVFTGVAVALVTFFDERGHVDLAATAKHAAHLVERGVRAVVVSGTTGEASHLSTKERLQLLDAVRATVGDAVPVILGTGNLAAGVSVPGLTRRAAEHGASAAITLSPSHGDVREFYGEVVAAAGSMPVLAYHYPEVSAPGISIEELRALKVAGIKDSSGDCERLLETLAQYHKPVYTGSSAIVAWAAMLGCAGAILAAANLEPELCLDAFAGSVQAQKDLLGAHKILTLYGIKGIKEELARKFATSTVCR